MTPCESAEGVDFIIQDHRGSILFASLLFFKACDVLIFSLLRLWLFMKVWLLWWVSVTREFRLKAMLTSCCLLINKQRFLSEIGGILDDIYNINSGALSIFCILDNWQIGWRIIWHVRL